MQTTLAYIAGFIDGEGCIDTNGWETKHHLRLRIGQKHPDILEFIREVFDDTFETRGLIQEKRREGRINYVLVYRHDDTVTLLESDLLGHLRVKRNQAEVALHLAKDRSNNDLAQQLKALKS